MSKHFKMYIKVNDIIGEKTIYLAYPILGNEIAVLSIFSENIRYEFMEPWTIELESRNKKVTAGTYMKRELIDLVGKIELTQFDKNLRIKRTNKLADVKEMVLNLTELDNTDNLEDGRLSNALLTHHVTGSEDFISFEPVHPSIRSL